MLNQKIKSYQRSKDWEERREILEYYSIMAISAAIIVLVIASTMLGV